MAAVNNAVVLKPNLHPLLNDVVMNNVFKYLPLKDIIKHRTVCKLWHSIGTNRLVDRIDEIKIIFGTTFSTDTPDPRKTIERFLQMDKSFSFTNFSSYYFENDSNPMIPNAKQTLQLFNQYGHHIKKVQLNLCGEKSWRFLSDVLLNKSPDLIELHLDAINEWNSNGTVGLFSGKKKPELKLKTLILHSQDEFENPTYSKRLLTDLFKSSPHLESIRIELDIDNGHEGDCSHEVLILRTLRDNGNISNFKEICLSKGDEAIFELLATSFKSALLKEFSVRIEGMDSTMFSKIETFLNNHKNTWEILDLTFPCVEFGRSISFPKMKNLNVLSINEWCLDEEELDEYQAPFGIFNFGQQFPNLVTLDLYEDPKSEGRSFFDLDDWFPEKTTPLLTLKNLRLPPILHSVTLRRIGRIFPNVLKLILVPQTPDVLRELWTTWPEIKSLVISLVSDPSYLSTNVDSIFTGMPLPDAFSIALYQSQLMSAADIESLRKFPSISQLKKLRHLIIHQESRFSFEKDFPGVDIRIKDVTVHLALRNLKELVFLYISRDRYQISSSCIQNLCTELDLLMGTREGNNENGVLLVKYEWQKEVRLWNPFLDHSLPTYV